MAMSDPIADFLTRIRNAIQAEHRFVDVSWSKMKESIADILKNKGFIEHYLIQKDEHGRGKLRIFLKYKEGRRAAITGLKRVSRPGLRRYVKHNDIPCFFGGLGVPVISTSSGLLAGSDANAKKVGGELLFLIW